MQIPYAEYAALLPRGMKIAACSRICKLKMHLERATYTSHDQDWTYEV